MAGKILKHKKHRIGLAIFGGFVIIVLIAALLINNYWSPILAKKVKNAVTEASNGLYTIDFSSAELHILKGEIILNDIVLKPDTAVYNKRKQMHIAPNNLFELHLKKLILYHIHPFKLYFKHKLDISEVIMRGPEVHLTYQLNHKTDTTLKNRKTLWQQVSKSLHSIRMGNIYLDNVKFRYEDYSGNKMVVQELKELNLSAHNLLIDSATQHDTSRTLYCKEITADLNNYTGKSRSGLYTFGVKHLYFSTLTSRMDIEGFTLTPANEFLDKVKKDRFTLSLDSIQLNHFDYVAYHRYRKVKASSMVISRGDFALFNNPNKVQDTTKSKLGSFPSVALANLETEVKLDTAIIRHLNVAYSEFGQKSRKTGTITFDNCGGRFLNITNNQQALQKNHICTADVSSLFMGKAKMNVHLSFDLTAKDAAYSYKGFVGPMDLGVMNKATVPFAMVKITSGKLKSFDFDIHANDHIGKGTVTLSYSDLKVKLLKPDSALGLKQKIVESFYTNLFILKHNNPDKDGEIPSSYAVSYIRPEYFPFFKTVWHTLLTGIKPSVGLNKKVEREAKQQLDQKEIRKKNRVIKREQRKVRRAERKAKRALKKQLKEQQKQQENPQ